MIAVEDFLSTLTIVKNIQQETFVESMISAINTAGQRHRQIKNIEDALDILKHEARACVLDIHPEMGLSDSFMNELDRKLQTISSVSAQILSK